MRKGHRQRLRLLITLVIVTLSGTSVAASLQWSTLQTHSLDTHGQSAIELAGSLQYLTTKGFQFMSELEAMNEEPLWEPLRSTLFAFIYLRISITYATMVHEVGHAEVGTLLGLDPFFGAGLTDENPEEDLSALELLWSQLMDPSKRAYTGYNTSKLITYRENAYLIGQGMNINTRFSKYMYEDALKSKRLRYWDGIAIFYNKMYTPLYIHSNLDGKDSIGDPNQYVTALNNQGIDMTTDTLWSYIIWPSILSGSTVNFFFGNKSWEASNYQREFLSWELMDWQVYWPEFEVYLNPDHVSSVTTFYARQGDLLLKVGLEDPIQTNTKPKTGMIGSTLKIGDISIDSEVHMTTKGHYMTKTAYEFPLIDRIKGQVKGLYGDEKTSVQEREWPHSNGYLVMGIKVSLD